MNIRMAIKAEIKREALKAPGDVIDLMAPVSDPNAAPTFTESSLAAFSQAKVNVNVRQKGEGLIGEDELKILLSKKAEQTELQKIADSKTNKYDSEQQLRAIDIMHRQLDHTVILLMEIIKG